MKNKDKQIIKDLKYNGKIMFLVCILFLLGMFLFAFLFDVNAGRVLKLEQQLESCQEKVPDEIEIDNSTLIKCGMYFGEVQYMDKWFNLKNCEVIE